MNMKLLQRLKNTDRISDTWCWNGKLFAKGLNGAGPFVIKLNTDVDKILSLHNKGSRTLDIETQKDDEKERI